MNKIQINSNTNKLKLLGENYNNIDAFRIDKNFEVMKHCYFNLIVKRNLKCFYREIISKIK